MLANLSLEQSLMKAKSYANKGELAEAQKLYETILKKFSNNIRAQQGLSALNKHKQNNNTENPSQDVLNQLVALYNQGQITTVIKQAELLTKQYPASPIIWNMIGVSRAQIGMLNEAIEAYKKCISLKPNFSDAHFNMGIALNNYGKSNEAIEAFNKAISYNPNHAEAYNNLGNVLQDKGRLGEAVEAHRKSILLKPDYAEAYFNMGVALLYQDKIEEAIEAFKKSISLKPDYPEAHHNLSFSLLRNGNFKEGLDVSEWRWKNPEFLSMQKYRNFLQPQWDGIQSLHDKRILLWCEQGIGDTLNWSSCLSILASKAKHCILECQEKLVPLLTRSFPNIEIKAENRSRDIERDDFDYHLPMGSLYKHFLDDIIKNPNPDAYLVPDPDRVNYWKERLKSLGNGPYIGIAWKSSVTSHYRSLHYPSISEWSPVLSIPEVTFINLQYKDYADDLAKVKDEFGVTVHNFEDLDQWNNIDDVAALCAALDMVTTNHGTVPLISAGVGTSTKLANWKQSPWNTILNNPRGPSVDIFERNTWEPWDNVFNLIRDEILIQKKMEL